MLGTLWLLLSARIQLIDASLSLKQKQQQRRAKNEAVRISDQCLTLLQEDFTPMISVTLEKAARNVLMDLLCGLTKRLENQSKIASPAQKVTMELSLQMLDFELYFR